jgi:RNA polymerase sigma-70 factor (ECF subfamily)
MLGSIGDAEDAVQDTFLRWHGAASDEIRSPQAWLVTTVTRLCLDRTRAAAAERQAYPGPWLPEPWVELGEDTPGWRLERAADLSLAFLALLQRLAPEERAAFLLHDVFELGYPDIARTLERTEAACRQMVHRARERVCRDQPRFEATEADRERLVRQYIEAVNAGDKAQLLALFAPAATLASDGGGKAWAARNVIHGADAIVRLELGVARKLEGLTRILAYVNGEPGMLTLIDGRPTAVTAFETDGRRVLAVLRVLNPDKLRSISLP